MVQSKFAVRLLAVIASALVAACGGGGGGSAGSGGGSAAPVPSNATYSVSGTVSGLAAGASLVLQNNGGDNLPVTKSGAFVFPTSLPTGSAYKVTVLTQPTAQTCTVGNGTGSINGTAVTNVSVVCSTNTYSVSGTVSGLAGGGLVLLDNGGDALTVSANGAFTFATKVASGAAYNVSVGAQPSGPAQTCTVTGGAGSMGSANVTNITVVCSTNAYVVSGTVTGLVGSGLVLQDNNGDNLSITANGAFTFATKVVSGTGYNVTVFQGATNPAQTCTVVNGAGTIAAADVANVAVNCTTNSYTIGGTATGLAGTGLVLASGADVLNVSANGTFTFAAKVLSGGAYNVTVSANPTGLTQTCSVTNGAGLVVNANITNVSVVCSTNTYTISGTISGLAGTGLVLQDNGADNFTVAANGAFSFATKIASGSNYNVTVLAQPSGPTQTCTVSNGTGLVVNANISNVAVVCSTNSYFVSATVSGLTGTGLVLADNGGDFLNVTANGTYTFATPVASGGTYNVTVSANPTNLSQTCTVGNFSGTVANANATNITVTCTTNSYTIGGSAAGLAGTGLVLQDNGGDFLSIAANGAFAFATPVASGGAYSVAVKAQPAGQLCTVSGGAGAVTSANITNVTVNCVNSYTIGGTVTGLSGAGLVLQNNGGDFLNIAANGTFTFATPLFTGNSYNVAVNTSPTNPAQVCSVSGGLGTVASGNVSVAVNCIIPVPRYVFSVGFGDNSVSTYVVDASTGRIKYISKAAAGTSPMAATVDPSGKLPTWQTQLATPSRNTPLAQTAC